MKKASIIGIFVLGILIGSGATYTSLTWTSKVSGGQPQLEGSIVLSEKYPDGSLRETAVRVPYDVTGTYPVAVLRLSPDKTKITYSVWENARTVLYVADADGSNARKIAEQSVPEGSGGLNVESVSWNDDGTEISYSEVGMRCPKKSCTKPADFVSEQTNYSVNVMTSDKRVMLRL